MPTINHAILLPLLLAGAVPAAAQDTGGKEQTQAAVDGYNRAYAEALGVSVAEGVAYQAKVAEASALDARLRGRSDYAGFRVLPGATFRAEFDFTANPDALAALTRDPAFTARRIRFAPDAVRRALEALAAALRAFSQANAFYYDPAAEAIRLHVRPGSGVGTLLAPLRLDVPVDVREDGMVPQVTADHEGGRPVTSSSEGWTSGLSVTHNDGRQGITTAGHAPNISLQFKGSSIPYVAELYGTRDLQWHTGGSNTYTPHVWVGSGYLLIQQLSALAAGVPVCMQGNVNSNRCGRIAQTNVSGTDNLGKSFANAVSFRRDDNSRMVSKGDSGAPMVTADGGVGRAHGVEFAGFDSINGTDFRGGLYVKVEDFGLLNLRPQTRPPN